MGYALLALAWMVAQPPFSSPDEDHHYVRALGASEGQLAGRGRRSPGGRRARAREGCVGPLILQVKGS